MYECINNDCDKRRLHIFCLIFYLVSNKILPTWCHFLPALTAAGLTVRSCVPMACVAGRHTSYSKKEYAVAVEALEYLKRELKEIADEATTDCYNEYEQIAGWCAYLEIR